MVTNKKERERKEFAARLNMALDEFGVPPKGKGRQTVVAKMFDVSQKGARKWLEGEGMPDTTKIPEIANKLKVRAEWLLTGKGPMRAGEESKQASHADETLSQKQAESLIAHLSDRVSPRSKQSLLSIQQKAAEGKLTEEDLEVLEAMAERLVAKHKEEKPPDEERD